VTLGIYGLYWYFKVNAEVRGYDDRVKVEPVVSLLAITFGALLIVPPFVSIYKTGTRIAAAQEAAGTNERANGMLGLLLAFLWVFYMPYYQTQLNKVWDRYGNKEADTALA
jgi:hypothetical protein